MTSLEKKEILQAKNGFRVQKSRYILASHSDASPLEYFAIITLRCLINVPPRLLIFGFFPTPLDLIRTPCLLISKKLNLLPAC